MPVKNTSTLSNREQPSAAVTRRLKGLHMPHRTQCPHCEKIGFVRTEHVITGTIANVAFYCGACGHQWSVTERPPPALLPKPRSQSFGPTRD
jgi:hypothetical protein